MIFHEFGVPDNGNLEGVTDSCLIVVIKWAGALVGPLMVAPDLVIGILLKNDGSEERRIKMSERQIKEDE